MSDHQDLYVDNIGSRKKPEQEARQLEEEHYEFLFNREIKSA